MSAALDESMVKPTYAVLHGLTRKPDR
jgi:hypothetical protein